MRCRRKGGRLIVGAEGSVAVVVALSMIVLLGMGALAVDLGQIAVEHHYLQNTADAAASKAAQNLLAEQNVVPDNPTTPPYYSGSDYVTPGPKAAYDAAMDMIQTAATNRGLTWDSNGYKIDFAFGWYDDKSPQSSTNPNWDATVTTDMTTATNPLNTVQVTITRSAAKTGSSYTHSYGPVTNFFASIFGMSTTEMSATAKAYMGFIHTTYAGTVQLPIALPAISGGDCPLTTSSRGKSSWWGPDQAVAATTKTVVFRDSAGYYVPGSSVPQNVQQHNPNVNSGGSFGNGDATQIYFFTVGSNDSVPDTLDDILTTIYDPNSTKNSSNPTHVGQLSLGQRIYPRTEYCWGKGSIGPLFQKLQSAYNYSTTGNKNTAPPAGTPWPVTLAVYGTTPNPLAASPMREGFRYLARLLAPWPTEAFACCTITAPKMYVNGFVNADIVGVNHNPNCEDGKNYTFPKTITNPNHPPVSGSTTYQNILDFLTRYSNSVWNTESLTIANVTDVSSIIPGATADSTTKNLGGLGGGLSANQMNSAAPAQVGAFANIPTLIH
jgi:Putative Flp pilus-assembly TadE/G-like